MVSPLGSQPVLLARAVLVNIMLWDPNSHSLLDCAALKVWAAIVSRAHCKILVQRWNGCPVFPLYLLVRCQLCRGLQVSKCLVDRTPRYSLGNLTDCK
jgi:hypothetical protein